MFRQNEWHFTGASGATYTFALSPKSSELPEAPGILMLAYTHPRGHRAGWQINVLHIRQCADLRGTTHTLNRKCCDDANWNCNYYLVETDERTAEEITRDLSQAYPPPC